MATDAATNYCLDARTATTHFPGIGRYVVNLARAMKELLAEGERLVLLCDPTSPSPWDLTSLESEQVQVVNIPISPFSLRQQWAIPRLLRSLRPALYHSPYYLMPYRPGLPTVLTLHDLIPLIFPAYFPPWARLVFRLSTTLALRTSTAVIAISKATAEDLRRYFAAHLPRIEIIPEAPDPRFCPQPPTEVERIRRKYSLPAHYILYLGINKPHKNLVRLIEAWAQICKGQGARGKRQGTRGKRQGARGKGQLATCHSPLATRPSPLATCHSPLIIAGAWDPRYPEPKRRAEELGLGDSIRFLGPVPEEDLPGLYAGATLFVFPSLYEGFGLPVLEAMACGTPVVCSRTSSLPELVGEAALTFNPFDIEEMAAKIEKALSNESLREEMSKKGLQQAAKFSWKEAAKETLELYRSVV